MQIGSHLRSDSLTDVESALEALSIRGADAAQIFLTDPQSWDAPKPDPLIEAIVAAWSERGVALYIHAPYIINVASTNNRIRVPSRRLLAAHATRAAELGARGLIVHGGHVVKGEDPDAGVAHWRTMFVNAVTATGLETGFPLPLLIENTAGGERAMARLGERVAVLWDSIGEFSPGFCLDTAHAHAAEGLTGAVARFRAITGSIDLVHANDSQDAEGSGRDRHANFGEGTIGPEAIVAAVRDAECDAIVETPGPAEAQARDIAFLRGE